MKKSKIFIVVTAVMLLLTGTSFAKTPYVDTSDPTKMTVDGLYPVAKSRIDVAFAKPDIDLSTYTKVMLSPITISYKRNSYKLDDNQTDQMAKYFYEALNKQLLENGYNLVNSPDSDVLLIDASIVDLYINRPTRPTAGRSSIFTASSGEITLIGELKDSLSGEILVRFADRQRPRSYWAESTSVSEWTEVRRAFNFWGSILRERLDAFHKETE